VSKIWSLFNFPR